VYATRVLAEEGHDVIRVESPSPDNVRRLGPFLGGKPDFEDGAYHQFFNAGKRSFALDPTTADGREVFAKLVETADVIVRSDSGVLTEAEIRAINPNAVLTLLVNDDRPEICAYTRAGLLALTGHPGKMPVLMGGHIVYAATATYVAVGTSAAMLTRKISGKGETVTVDIQQCFETFLDHAVEDYTARGRPTQRRGHRGAVTPISGAFPAKDGFWMLSLGDQAERWTTFMNWMKDPVLAGDEKLLLYEERVVQRDMILDRIGKWAKDYTKEEVVTHAQSLRFPSSPVNTSLELSQDDQLIARGFLTEVDHPKHGRMWFPRGALATLWDNEMKFAPRLGENNKEILDELGYSDEEQVLLFERGVI